MSLPIMHSNLSHRTLLLRAKFTDQVRSAWINRQIAYGSKMTATIAACFRGYPLAEKFYAANNPDFTDYRGTREFVLADRLETYAPAIANPQARGHLAAINALSDLAQAGYPKYAYTLALTLHDQNRAASEFCAKIAAKAGHGEAAYHLASKERGKNPDLERKYLILAAAHGSTNASWDLARAYANPDHSGGMVKKQNIVLALWYASKVLVDLPTSSNTLIDDLMPAAKRQGLHNRYPTVFKTIRKRMLRAKVL